MDTTNDDTVTKLLTLWKTGQPQAIGRLVEAVYDDLLRIARRQMRGERPGHTLQTAALVHEAYLRFVELRRIDWRDRGHFFTVAAAVMRRVLIDQARSAQARKRGGEAVRVTLDEGIAAPEGAVDVLALDRALQRLAERDETLGHIVNLRYFAGLTVEKTAEALHLAPATVKRKWRLAQAWLYRELHEAVA
ncbi:MAG: sigma-70 family RNA polymerase sigma factor [Pseudomonadota bacterium]|nr:sigma-70 family RNA polymerase sigma factor [Pseudomonadota bacterium]